MITISVLTTHSQLYICSSRFAPCSQRHQRFQFQCLVRDFRFSGARPQPVRTHFSSRTSPLLSLSPLQRLRLHLRSRSQARPFPFRSRFSRTFAPNVRPVGVPGNFRPVGFPSQFRPIHSRARVPRPHFRSFSTAPPRSLPTPHFRRVPTTRVPRPTFRRVPTTHVPRPTFRQPNTLAPVPGRPRPTFRQTNNLLTPTQRTNPAAIPSIRDEVRGMLRRNVSIHSRVK